MIMGPTRNLLRRALGFYLALVGLALILPAAAQSASAAGTAGQTGVAAKTPAAAGETAAAAGPSGEAGPASRPVLRDYKGVALGAGAEEVHAKLGPPAGAADGQESFAMPGGERVTVHYDAGRRVLAVAATYPHDSENAPTPRDVFGADLAAAADGSLHRRVEYPREGFWVAYTRTAGEDPVTIVVLKRMPNAR